MHTYMGIQALTDNLGFTEQLLDDSLTYVCGVYNL